MLRLLKVAGFVLSVFYIAWYISARKPEMDDQRVLSELREKSGYLYGVFFLMLVNWSLEAVKWRMLMISVEAVSFLRSLRAVFTGVTISFYTPNRVGEFAGRILHLDPEHRVRGALATFVGSTAQVMITLQAGLAALLYFREDFLNSVYRSWLIFPLSVIILVLPLAWLQIPRLAHIKHVGKLLNRYPSYLEVFDHYNRNQLMQVYLLSVLRYAVFCTQQYLLLTLFGFQGTWLLSTGLSALSFLLISIIPSIAMGELGMRGGINLYVFSTRFPDAAAILISTFLLWFINLAIPAMAGAIGLLYIKIRRTE